MVRTYIYTLLLTFVAYTFSYAQSGTTTKEINLEKAGTLESVLTESERASIESIKITGVVNEADIAVLQKMATENKLKKIDLGKASFGETINELLADASQYFLPMIEALGTDNIAGVEAFEAAQGHEKDSRSLPGFWIFSTGKELFFMTGYMNGWDGKMNEVVLKSKSDKLLRSPQIRAWIDSMGYKYVRCRTDGDVIFHNEKTNIWCLLHFTPYSKSDYPGVQFSSEEYAHW